MREIIVVPSDPDWPNQYRREADRVHSVLPTGLMRLQHIGSTSVPGLAAKPIIDMLGEVGDLQDIDRHTVALENLGYEAMGEFGIAGRRYFRLSDADGVRRFHIHCFETGSAGAVRHLAFRGYLSAHPEVADAYGELKEQLARQFPTSIEDYMEGKDAFVKSVEKRAIEWWSSPEHPG